MPRGTGATVQVVTDQTAAFFVGTVGVAWEPRIFLGKVSCCAEGGQERRRL